MPIQRVSKQYKQLQKDIEAQVRYTSCAKNTMKFPLLAIIYPKNHTIGKGLKKQMRKRPMLIKPEAFLLFWRLKEGLLI